MSGLRWITLSRALAQILTWANTFFVIRLISPTDFGLAALAGIFANFLSLLNELGFSVALVQKQTRDEETLRHVFGALLLIGSLLTAGLELAAPLVGVLVKDPRVVPLIRLIAVQFLAMSFAVIP
ncbi:MAG TPA: oligosaccharide flippase family protein, partial [Steroidobacteraceae bacterium]